MRESTPEAWHRLMTLAGSETSRSTETCPVVWRPGLAWVLVRREREVEAVADHFSFGGASVRLVNLT